MACSTGTLGYALPGDVFSIEAFGRNLTDTRYANYCRAFRQRGSHILRPAPHIWRALLRPLLMYEEVAEGRGRGEPALRLAGLSGSLRCASFNSALLLREAAMLAPPHAHFVLYGDLAELAAL
jgi:hypothetical protein